MPTDLLYHELLLDEANHPRHYGQLASPDQIVVERNASCGDQVTVELKFSSGDLPDHQKTIVDLKWRGDGCIISQAAMSVVAGLAVGKSCQQVKQLALPDVLQALNLESISPGRLRCVMLGLEAIKKAC